ncbi:MAG: TIGR03546 family protein [Bdellovibrionales bacterium RIFOXYD12_FULL_39_22]|nr:MAG: TIGR03546 family protein [Bdellovibrionales bacterium RIFOXYB1_FULL_39_21]OFZ42723.1 MAG: TIGR03546 family protein [Bdellovibrionales bacterium RIFOXYC12_FULL_39_17]OFZ47282.1 MAG: TIGR03546 family protein [Bdellovibrionales bacterium RIFOXYC1_FULL_39_130]OFZ55970.1 MAG: TIGR03546 family protein [Bdellovibrionales bacterium RIFOXYB2_FULL_36_6]OFZ71706.1 MAG: TIGR03546 family protein [Bdellovibrionales bacterium RIFOXYC2_FULL_39_8]OFZ75448.1 MAG: TIGR03546 family protein [Bdellovibriona
MTIILKQLFNFIKLLNSDTGLNQISAGIACGFILGMAPVFSLQTLLILFLMFFFRIQMGAAFMSAFFFAFMAYLLDPIFHEVGCFILEMDSLYGIFAVLYNTPIIPFTRFYNSVVMGAGVTSIILSPLIFLLARVLISKYRQNVVEKLKKSKLAILLKSTSFYKWYAKYDQFYG